MAMASAIMRAARNSEGVDGRSIAEFFGEITRQFRLQADPRPYTARDQEVDCTGRYAFAF